MQALRQPRPGRVRGVHAVCGRRRRRSKRCGSSATSWRSRCRGPRARSSPSSTGSSRAIASKSPTPRRSRHSGARPSRPSTTGSPRTRCLGEKARAPHSTSSWRSIACPPRRRSAGSRGGGPLARRGQGGPRSGQVAGMRALFERTGRRGDARRRAPGTPTPTGGAAAEGRRPPAPEDRLATGGAGAGADLGARGRAGAGARQR